MSKIKRLSVATLEYTLGKSRGYGNARGINHKRTCSLVTLETDDGTFGHGDVLGPPGVIREYLKIVTPFFIGRSLYDFEIVSSHIRNRLYHFGPHGHFIACLGGIDIAIRDAMGKTLGLPVHNLLGGCAGSQMPCYATTGYFTDSSENGIEAQLSKLKPGAFVGVKIKIGAGVQSDVDRVREARRAIGDDMLLMVDMNGNYTVDVALESIKRIEPFGIQWCEEPLPPSDIRGYAELRSRSPIRLAAGEAHSGIQDYKNLIEARAIDIMQPSLTGGGGFSEMKAAILLAQMNNIRVSVPCWGSAIALNAAIHFAASLPVWPHTDNAPYPMTVEYDVGENPFREALDRNAVQPTGGFLPVPKGPGLGLQLNQDIVNQYTVA